MKIKLLGPHKHDCTEYPAGAEVDLADWEANWLIGLGKAERMLVPEEENTKIVKTAKGPELSQEAAETAENWPVLQGPPLPLLAPVQNNSERSKRRLIPAKPSTK